MKYAIVHVADIHYRASEPEGALNIMKSFIKDLENQKNRLDDHQFYLAITGDIVQSGSDFDSYESVIKKLGSQFDQAGIKKDSRIIVPGNHDIDRDVVKEEYSAFVQLNEHTISESTFNNFMDSRNLFHKKFDNFELFLSEFGRYDDSFSSLGWVFKINDDMGVYCLNSAICSYGGYNDIKDEGQLAIYTRGLVKWCDQNDTSTNILLLHHPLNHLKDWSRTELQSIIEQKFSLCLYGHNHYPEVYHDAIPKSSLMCSAPPLFSNKQDTLAYSIVLIENNAPSGVIYREYAGGKFYPSPRLSKTEDGIARFDNPYLHNVRQLELCLKNALQSFKGQPCVFVKPKLSDSREFNDKVNLLDRLIDSPENVLIGAPPQFGLTCLAYYMRVEAFKARKKLWIYIDATHVKSRNFEKYIDEELNRYRMQEADIECIIIDSWDNSVVDHSNIAKKVELNYSTIPLILLSSKTECLNSTFKLAKVNRTFQSLHLQALTRGSMRELVSSYNKEKIIGKDDDLIAHMAKHMEAINIHRTALNCYTLLKVLDGNFNEKVLNRTKLMKAILFVLFTDDESFSFSSDNPEVDECTYILGKYCKNLVMQATGSFDSREFVGELKKICAENLMTLNVERMIDVFLENNILVSYGNTYEFKHTFWIFYFAAECMLHDEEFKKYILGNKKYVNFPEIIEFYAGIDGNREDAINVLLTDLKSLIDSVDSSIGIHGTFNPLSTFLWNPSDGFIEQTKNEIAEKVESSNLPVEIKDEHADKNYDSQAPYNQTINNFLEKYSVRGLLQSIRATSRALRNSTFIDPSLKIEAIKTIFSGWEEISKVIFWLSPLLAKNGMAGHDGLNFVLASGFSDDAGQRFKEILIANPANVVRILKDDLSSKKLGPLLCRHLAESKSEMQKHLIAKFLLEERPTEWATHLLDHLNLLHPSSYYLGNLLTCLNLEIKIGFFEKTEEAQLKKLVGAVLAKRRYAGKSIEKRPKTITPGMMISEDNRLPIDQLLSKPASKPQRNKHWK